MRILSFHILFISILLSGLLPSHAVWAQTTVQTAAQTKLSHSLDGDTARIILLDNFNRYSARFVGNKLILQFDRPVSPTVKSSFFNDLKEYVVSIEPRPEENILQFTLSNPYFTIRKFKGNGFVGIDLVKQDGSAEVTSLDASLSEEERHAKSLMNGPQLDQPDQADIDKIFGD